MRIRYLEWRAGVAERARRERLLRQLLSYLLVRHDGNAARALEHLELLAERHGLLGPDLSFEDLKKALEEERWISDHGSGPALTPKGERMIRLESLDQIFRDLKRGRTLGEHPTRASGPGGERTGETRPYRFGDELAEIDFNRSFRNAYARTVSPSPRLEEQDLEVCETERHISTATVLMVDVSHSMVLYGEDRITPAKRVALALTELILSRYPKDAFHVVLFGDHAWEISVRDLTYSGVGPYHTNTRAGLALARRILMRMKHDNRQIFMITDGKPSALYEHGELYLNPFGLDRRIVNKTLDEAAECRRHGIPITTFMVARDPLLVRFVETLARVNRGRAYFSSVDNLEQAVFVDFLRNRQRRVR